MLRVALDAVFPGMISGIGATPRVWGGQRVRATALGLLACVSVLAPVRHGSADEVAETLSLPALLEEARQQNPELRASREQSAAKAAMPAQARAWDDPTLSYEAWNAPNSFRVDRADNNIFRLSQRIPFPGKRALAADVATHEAAQSMHESEAVELDVVTAVKRAYFELWLAYEQLAVLSREKALVERFSHVVEERYATSDAVQADVLRSHVELTHLVNRVRTEGLAIESARAELAALLSRTKESLSGRPEALAPPTLDLSTDDVVSRALERRPDVRAQDAAIAREESAGEAGGAEPVPRFRSLRRPLRE